MSRLRPALGPTLVLAIKPALLMLAIVLATLPLHGEETVKPENPAQTNGPDKAAVLEAVKAGIAEAARSGKKTIVWVTVFREAEKTELAGADAKALHVKVQGNAIPLAWEKLTPEQIADVAKQCVQGNAQRALALVDYCLASGLTGKADEALTLAAQCDANLGEAFTRRMAQVKAQRDAAEAKSATAVREAVTTKTESGTPARPTATGSPAVDQLRAAMPWPGARPLPPSYQAKRPELAPGLKKALVEWCKGKGLQADVTKLESAEVGIAKPPDPGILPPIQYEKGNPFYDSYLKQAEAFVSGEGKSHIHAAWALTHPQSPLMGNPKLLGPLLDYLEECATGKQNIDHQFGLVAPSRIFLLLWRRYPDLIPPSRKEQWEAAFRKLAGNACNRTRRAAQPNPSRIVINLSIADATSIANLAAAFDDDALRAHADAIFAGVPNHMWEDGGYNYMTEAMPPPHYHSVLTRSLLEYWLLTGKEIAREQLVRMWWWWPLMLRSHNPNARGIGLDITTVAWKKAGIYIGYNNRACSSAYVVAMVSGSPENLGLSDTQVAIRTGGLEGHEFLGAVIWRPELKGSPLPDRWMVWDRNAQGPNAKFGAFSAHGASRQKTATPGMEYVGRETLVGAMVNPPGELSAVAASGLHCGVQMKPGPLPTAGDEAGRDRYAVWHHQARSSSSVWQQIGGISGTHRKTTVAIGNLASGAVPFISTEAWVFTENRLIGLMTLRAEQKAEALALSAAVRIARTKDFQGEDLGKGCYGYGPLGICVHKTSLAQKGNFLEKEQRALEWIDPVAANEGRTMRSYAAGTEHYILLDCYDRKNTQPATDVELLDLRDGLIGFSFNDGRQRIRMIANPQSSPKRYQQDAWPQVQGEVSVVTSGMQDRPAWMDSFIFPFKGALTTGEALIDPNPTPRVVKADHLSLTIPPDGHVILVSGAR